MDTSTKPSAAQVLADFEARGFLLWLPPDGLRVAPSSKLTAADRAILSAHKAALTSLLAALGDGTALPESAYRYITDAAALEEVKAALAGASLVALDTETTGLNPRQDRLRLLQLAVDGMPPFIIDAFEVDPYPLWEILAGKEIVGHNLGFDLGFLARLGFVPKAALHDTMLLSQLIHAAGQRQPKGFHSLEGCLERELSRPLDKSEQKSSWASAGLTPEQLEYAARDVHHLLDLHRKYGKDLEDDARRRGDKPSLKDAAAIESRYLPAHVWLSGNGVLVDRSAWERLAREAEQDAECLRQELDDLAPPKPGGTAWNWNSPKQVKQVFELLGITLDSTDDAHLSRVTHPLAQLLRAHRDARKRATTYGVDWLKHVRPDGRVYPSWHQLGSQAGRMSCSGPNVQQLPQRYRQCIVASPGCVLIACDYSQIELRIAAKLSEDSILEGAFLAHADMHKLTASSIPGSEALGDKRRSFGKTMNFALLYGMGVRRFREYVWTACQADLTIDVARQYRDAFFRAYPGLAAWHARVRREHASETRTLAGRRRNLTWQDSDTLRLNSPDQGTGADGLKLAMAMLWEMRHEFPDARLILSVHDELVIEVAEDQAEAAAVWLRSVMIEAMRPLLTPVPVAVDVGIGFTWGDTIPLAEWVEGKRPERPEPLPVPTAVVVAPEPPPAPEPLPLFAEVAVQDAAAAVKAARRQQLITEADADDDQDDGEGSDGPSIEEWRARRREEPESAVVVPQNVSSSTPRKGKPEKFQPLTSPIKWHGGKSYQVRGIVALMPNHLHYVEPYAGALWVLLARDPNDMRFKVGEKSHECGASEVVNDLNGNLTNFWRVLQGPEDVDRFRLVVEAMPFSEREWQDAAERLADPDPVVRAVAFFVHCRQSLGARMNAFTSTTKKRTRRMMNAEVSAWLTAIEGLPEVHARLKQVLILNQPALDVIRGQDHPYTLFYLDPPYSHETRTATKVYGEFEMTDADHRELLTAIKAIQGKVILSGYGNELYDRELAGWRRETKEIANHAAGGKSKHTMTEVYWLNF
jgi:DNA polymerase-1